MYDRLTIPWATSLLGFLSIAMLPIPWILSSLTLRLGGRVIWLPSMSGNKWYDHLVLSEKRYSTLKASIGQDEKWHINDSPKTNNGD